jgi:hypothetical protein
VTVKTSIRSTEQGGEATVALSLHDDLGIFVELDAIIDTGLDGELYVGYGTLAALRLDPSRGHTSWNELDPQPCVGAFDEARLPTWEGRVALPGDAPRAAVVQEGRREHPGAARVGRAFLRRFALVLLYDPERSELTLLQRPRAEGS